MHRLGVYRIRLPKNYICKPPRYTTLVWRETEGDGEGDITRLVAKDADTSDSICQRTKKPIFDSILPISLHKSHMKKKSLNASIGGIPDMTTKK